MYVFMTDFGEVTPGPKFQALLDEIEEGLSMNRRTKAYKHSKAEFDKIEQAACLIARAEWISGEVPRVTP